MPIPLRSPISRQSSRRQVDRCRCRPESLRRSDIGLTRLQKAFADRGFRATSDHACRCSSRASRCQAPRPLAGSTRPGAAHGGRSSGRDKSAEPWDALEELAPQPAVAPVAAPTARRSRARRIGARASRRARTASPTTDSAVRPIAPPRCRCACGRPSPGDRRVPGRTASNGWVHLGRCPGTSRREGATFRRPSRHALENARQTLGPVGVREMSSTIWAKSFSLPSIAMSACAITPTSVLSSSTTGKRRT